jgi:hypothetical protein
MFTIEIDATALVYRQFIVPGVTASWVDAKTVQTLSLSPGSYSFQIASGYFADFTFQVGADGRIDYDPAFSSFLSGRGTARLTIQGFQVTLDARYLTGAGILLVAPAMDFIRYATVRMVPASHYQVQQGSGQVAQLVFQLDRNGQFQYDETRYGGFLRGRGTSTLEFQGYPLLVDARLSGGDGVTIAPVASLPFAANSVEHANLLPANGFRLQVRSGRVSDAGFSLSESGSFTLEGGAATQLAVAPGGFHGLTLLTVNGAL